MGCRLLTNSPSSLVADCGVMLLYVSGTTQTRVRVAARDGLVVYVCW